MEPCNLNQQQPVRAYQQPYWAQWRFSQASAYWRY